MHLMIAQQVVRPVTVRLKTTLWMMDLMTAQQVVREGNTAGDASNDSPTGGTPNDSPSDNDDGQSETNVQTRDLEKAVKTGWVNSFCHHPHYLWRIFVFMFEGQGGLPRARRLLGWTGKQRLAALKSARL